MPINPASTSYRGTFPNKPPSGELSPMEIFAQVAGAGLQGYQSRQKAQQAAIGPLLTAFAQQRQLQPAAAGQGMPYAGGNWQVTPGGLNPLQEAQQKYYEAGTGLRKLEAEPTEASLVRTFAEIMAKQQAGALAYGIGAKVTPEKAAKWAKGMAKAVKENPTITAMKKDIYPNGESQYERVKARIEEQKKIKSIVEIDKDLAVYGLSVKDFEE